MIFMNCDMHELLEFAQDKTLICFGAGKMLTNACSSFSDVSFFDKIDLIADNNKDLSTFIYKGKQKPVASIESCTMTASRTPFVLVTVTDCYSIVEQLNNIPELDNCYFSIYTIIDELVEPYQLPVNRAEHEPLRIPKVIHYCWFGETPIPDNILECTRSWEKYCPDYEIVRWDESNYDYKKNEYMYEAYKHRKWGFVSDYARLDIIYQHGGVYFDTDVELVKNIDDLLCDEAFCGFESRCVVANGLGFGAVAGYPLIGEQLEIYSDVRFFNGDGTLNLTPSPVYNTQLLSKKGLMLNNTLQTVEGMKVYPSDVLSPYSCTTGLHNITDNTHAIHHYSATWRDNDYYGELNNTFCLINQLLKNNHIMLKNTKR